MMVMMMIIMVLNDDDVEHDDDDDMMMTIHCTAIVIPLVIAVPPINVYLKKTSFYRRCLVHMNDRLWPLIWYRCFIHKQISLYNDHARLLSAFVYNIIVKVIIIIIIIIICITSTVAIYHSYDLNSANIIISIPSFPTSIKISLKWSLLKLPARGIDKNKREEYCIKSKSVRFALLKYSKEYCIKIFIWIR